ncbi:MAG: hypothetical protein KC418_07275 [Anaerolineales bacterium]|nr:hypothetical protein [Anaerolineales bacterium]MCB8950570.1 hypothetical protein [Ardenticatenales bacterium]
MKWLRKLFEGEYDAPQGTMVLLALFLFFIIVLWGNAYLHVVTNGTTQ